MLTSRILRVTYLTVAGLVTYLVLAINITVSQAEDPYAPDVLRALALKSTNSLKTVKVVDAPTFKQFVVDRPALIQLGKALFWDQKVGSGNQSCASCHFHAGADNRSKNQVNPGFRSTLTPGGDMAFGASPGGLLKANYQLTMADFPFHKLDDPSNRNSRVASDTNDVVSSQGAFAADFTGFDTLFNDTGTPTPSAVFRDVGGAMVRNVEPRNTPTVINAVLNHRNFWDGRGRNEFNGANPLGSLLPAKIVKVPSKNQIVFVQTRISDSSGASQAAGPPLSDLEMSYAKHSFAQIGRKLLNPNMKPLAGQTVDGTDSVFKAINNPPPMQPVTKLGLDTTYAALITKAFDPSWYAAPTGWVVEVINPDDPKLLQLPSNAKLTATQFTVMEYNFGLFMGMAINEYEKTLIADDSPFDQFMDGNIKVLGESGSPELRGLRIYLTNGKCINCHGGAEMTNASLSRVQGPEVLERMIMGNDRVAVYDNGFYNTGVRPTGEDLGVGAVIGPKNRPLSNTRGFQNCVNDALNANFSLSLVQANDSCGVPRILARPSEAATLLSKAVASINGQVQAQAQVTALLNQANTYLSAVPPDPVQGSCRLAKNLALPCPTSSVLNADGTTTVTQLDGALDVLAKFSADAGLLASAASLLPDPVSPGSANSLLAPVLGRNERVAVDGAFKTPTTRNVELTAPYFHNGGAATLLQMVEFYNRGGDFAAQNKDNLDTDIQPLNLSETDRSNLVAFLLTLTDSRVKYDRAPFDHPSLDIPNGGSSPVLFNFGSGSATIMDDRITLPAVGANGGIMLGTKNTPFANFLDPLK